MHKFLLTDFAHTHKIALKGCDIVGIGEKLHRLISERQTNVNELALAADVSPSTLYSIIKRDNTKADIDVLIRIANVLNVKVEYFSDIPLKAGVPSLSLGEETHIKKYRQLNDGNKAHIDDEINYMLDRQEKGPNEIPADAV